MIPELIAHLEDDPPKVALAAPRVACRVLSFEGLGPSLTNVFDVGECSQSPSHHFLGTNFTIEKF